MWFRHTSFVNPQVDLSVVRGEHEKSQKRQVRVDEVVKVSKKLLRENHFGPAVKAALNPPKD